MAPMHVDELQKLLDKWQIVFPTFVLP